MGTLTDDKLQQYSPLCSIAAVVANYVSPVAVSPQPVTNRLLQTESGLADADQAMIDVILEQELTLINPNIVNSTKNTELRYLVQRRI
jgi:hypothetical protein